MIDDTLITDNFDYWMELAKRDPDEFEVQRKQAVQDIIDSAPEHLKRRLMGLQWQIESEIKLTNSPMGACVRVNRMMMEKVFEKNGFLDVLTGNHDANKTAFNKSSVINMLSFQNSNR